MKDANKILKVNKRHKISTNNDELGSTLQEANCAC